MPCYNHVSCPVGNGEAILQVPCSCGGTGPSCSLIRSLVMCPVLLTQEWNKEHEGAVPVTLLRNRTHEEERPQQPYSVTQKMKHGPDDSPQQQTHKDV